MVEQLGLAIIPLCFLISCGLTSGTTKGTSGSILQALLLSTTTAPALAAIGANSLLTDPEVLEARFPIRLVEFSIRSNSGGSGQHHGGNGILRCIEFLESMDVNMISQHRDVPPPGIKGGKPGALGENILISKEQSKKLSGCFAIKVKKGDRLIIKTPGGGGFGS